MKKKFKLTALFVLLFTSLTCVACSSDDDDETIPSAPDSEKPEDNLPEEAKAFLGYWDLVNDRGYDFIFFEDGINVAIVYDYNYYESYPYSLRNGYWTYNHLRTFWQRQQTGSGK